MPRRLPWPAPKSAARSRSTLDDDEDFFAGTVLESSRKGKEKVNLNESDEELPKLPAILSPRKRRDGVFERMEKAERAPSSSPPPLDAQLHEQPKTEYMQKGLSKFDLRDDEWMMVEDEFLHTAKLFTRHLHLAEYERLKEVIQSKKAAKRDVARPVVADAKPSQDRKIHIRAQDQLKKQRKALKNVDNVDEYLGPPKRASSKTLSSSFSGSDGSLAKPLASRNVVVIDDSDSDDLDAPKRPSQKFHKSQMKPDSTASAYAKPALSSTSTFFAKPALPPSSRAASSRPIRASSFFVDDDYGPPAARGSSPPHSKHDKTSSVRSSSPPTKSPQDSTTSSRVFHTSSSKDKQASVTKPSQSWRSRAVARPGRSIDLWDESDLPVQQPSPSKSQEDRLAKRKAEREKEQEKERRKSIKLEDIPTFMF